MDFKGLGETPEDATNDNVHITTQMNLGVSTEDVDELPYILKSNPHPFYSFRALKNEMWIRITAMSCILEK